MWRMTPRLATAALTATLALLASAPEARSATVQTFPYTADGSVANMPGDQPIVFMSPFTSTLTTPGSFILGAFESIPLPSSATLTYNNTPFVIDLYVSTASPASTGLSAIFTVEPAYDYQISGLLNGTITGNGSSSMLATITSIVGFGGTPPFPVGDLAVDVPQGIAAPDGLNYGFSLLTAQVIPDPILAPEPGSIAALGVAAAGWLLRRRALARARSRAA